jgi:predicted ester cyclase
MPDILDTKRRTLLGLQALARASVRDIRSAALRLFDAQAACAVSHPINQLRGIDEIVDRYLRPLKTAFPDLERRDDILLAGQFFGGEWVAATGYYYGTLKGHWLGLPPSHHWVSVRYGEFYRLEEDRIVDCYVLLDLVDVLRQLHLNPLPRGLGIEGLCPGPATHDGLVLTAQDRAETQHSGGLVDAMIVEGLMGYDQVDHASIGMERYWNPEMMWYGPGGIGTTRGLSGFLAYHQYPWQSAFPDYVTAPAGINVAGGVSSLNEYYEQGWQRADPDYKGGRDLARFADGRYVAWNGWPSVRATHTGRAMFGVPPSGKAFTIRIMDFWRREGALLAENWVLIDIAHMLWQMGTDVFAAARDLAERSNWQRGGAI